MEPLALAAIVGGSLVFAATTYFFYARNRNRGWFAGIAALGLTPAGSYPYLSATGRWAGGQLEVRHFKVRGRRKMIVWHEVIYSRPGLSLDEALTRFGFKPAPDTEHTIHRKEPGELDAIRLRRFLDAIGARVSPKDPA